MRIPCTSKDRDLCMRAEQMLGMMSKFDGNRAFISFSGARVVQSPAVPY